MATVRKNPTLPDYFVELPEITNAGNAYSVTSLIEDMKIVVLPKLEMKIDFDYWARQYTNSYPRTAKVNTPVTVEGDTSRDAEIRNERLSAAGLPIGTARSLTKEMGDVLDQALPIYRKLFEGYRFTLGNIFWRLTDIYATKMHIDCYVKGPAPNHMARMFINLDTQPRIWHTSWKSMDLPAMLKATFPKEDVQALSANDLWTELNKRAFGPTVDEWWQECQKHAIFFKPGDVWLVDSRQVAHQIFYGRRAVSIDFVVDPASMLNPELHYLKQAERAREILLS